ncbi:MAG: hypothetical protein WD598_12315 [Acidimicrobiia bacterium]
MRAAAAAAALWCAGLGLLALPLTDEARPRIALAIPVVIATVAWWLVPTRAGRGIALAAGVLMMLFAFAAMLSVGLLYVPPAIALAFAASGIRQTRATVR